MKREEKTCKGAMAPAPAPRPAVPLAGPLMVNHPHNSLAARRILALRCALVQYLHAAAGPGAQPVVRLPVRPGPDGPAGGPTLVLIKDALLQVTRGCWGPPVEWAGGRGACMRWYEAVAVRPEDEGA